jgi:polyisoprenoid-binding protein YceI
MNILVPIVLASLAFVAPDEGKKPAAAAPASAAPAPITPRVKEPEPANPVPEGATLYHTLAGRDAQVVFTTDAPLEKIVGKSNEVVGFAIAGPKDAPAKLVGAEWLLPIKSLATGIPLRDEHLAAKEWLNADEFPNIRFVLSSVEDVKEVKKGDGFSTWSVTLIGQMSMHGVTKEIRVPDAKISFFEESEKTKNIAPGSLLFIKCDYTVTLSEFGIKHADVPKKVSDVVKLSQMLRLSTVPAQYGASATTEAAKPGTTTAPTAEKPKAK